MKNELRIKLLREEVQVPKYGSDLASGFDVRAYECVIWDRDLETLTTVEMVEHKGEKGWWIPASSTVILKTGLAMACGDHEEIQARARSGYSLKTPMRIANGIGTIDEDYRGEIGIIMDNNGQYGKWFIPYAERVAQLVVCPVVRPGVCIVNSLEDTERGAGGYGSTGTK